MAAIKIILLLATISYSTTEYIPPGPRYTCPKETTLLYPCVCEKGTDAGLYIKCENAGLAVLSVGVGNIAGLGLPIERLLLKECKIANLYGPLLHRSTLRVLELVDTPIKTIDEFAFVGVNRTLQEIYMTNTKMQEFTKDAFKILGNLTTLSIDGHYIRSFPKDAFSGSEAAVRLEKLRLTNGLLKEVASEPFQHLKKLKVLDLHGNQLETLKKSQFKGLRDAEVLDISYNNITKLDGSHIGDLTKLGWCNVSHNQIADIPRGMFARNTLLKVLHLDNNRIKKLDVNSFRGMRLLRRLYLQDNSISEVGRGTFASVTRIGTVDLSRNNISIVDYQMFQQVRYAELINLAENRIATIETQAFTDLYLAVVNISHNVLEKIEANSFINCNNMTLLDLSHNKLKSITRNAFDENSYASEFTVAYNLFENFGQIPIYNMTGIKLLNASHNAITIIPKLAFPKLYELHTVDVSYNNLTEIGNAVFQNLFSIRYLNLSHNSMEVIKPATFGTIPTVLELDLSYNRLRDVSRGSLAKLASCRVLDMSYNSLEKLFQIPISLGELNIAHNNLTEVPINTWPTMNSMLRLNMSHNSLEDRLTSDSFRGLLTLQVLDLSENGVTRPPWEALNTLSSLQYLYLQHNNLTSLSRSAFGNLPTLFRLDLSYNQLKVIEKRSFNGLQQLLDLSLRGNGLDTVPNEAFKSLVALRKLDLSYNNLEKIDNKTNGLLDDCLSIEMVNLSHNKFGFLTTKMFPYNQWIPYRLLEVDLSYNEIPVLTNDITVGAKKLKKLNLAGNILNDIRNDVLGNLTSLEVLDLSKNRLTDLISSTSDLKLNFPENITELYLQDNELYTLPFENLVKADKLKTLDVRRNQLVSFYPELVTKIRKGMEVYFEGNLLHCDCFVRPLKHYLNTIPPSLLAIDKKYQNLTCANPLSLQNEKVVSVDEERLLCAGNTELEDKIKKYSNTEQTKFDLETEPDLVFRDVQFSQPSIHAAWYVKSTEDIADFYIYIRNENNTLIYTNDIAYNLRAFTITIDNDLKTSLQNGGKFELCIQARKSSGFGRKWFPSQCQSLPPNFDSWSKKLNLDKRRSSKKKTSYSSNSVIGLLSDSILITFCIFLGACLRKLSDLDI